jgi:hypothetical protein
MSRFLGAKTRTRVLFVVAVGVGFFSSLGREARSRESDEKEFKPVVLIPPFENQTKQREKIDLEVATSSDPKNPKRSYKVDRYTEAPRSLFEHAVSNMKGVTIVERQRVDTLLVEAQFGETSGLVVDPEKAIKLGKLVGANLIIMGTIVDLGEETKSFKGYGVETQNVIVTAQVRFRVLDETGKVLCSKIVKGTKTYTKTSFGETKSSDRNFAAIQVALDKIAEDTDFHDSLLGKKGTADKDGTIQVEFAPKRSLKAGVEYKVKISKSGYKDWTGTISPEAGLKITRELEPNR